MIKSIVLDLCKHPNPPIQTVYLRQGDYASVTLDISVNEDGEPFNLTDYEARFMAALPNGKVVIDPCVKREANVVSYALPAALTALAGTVSLAYVSIYRGDEWIASTDCMTFKVKPGVDISAEAAEDKLGEYARMKAQLDAILELAEEQKETQQAEWESQMAAQEEDYQKAEAERAANEEARNTAENSRVEAEEARVAAENARKQAETARAEAEDTRVSQENARQAAEGTRVSNEDARMAAETARATAEKNRETAESERVSAESERAEAENARKAAEAKREEEIAKALGSIQEQTAITDEEIDDLWENA